MKQEHRIISLIPSATEIAYLLGLEDQLMARSHDSNYPVDALSKPVVSGPTIEVNGSSGDIDRSVRDAVHNGTSIFHLDQEALKSHRPSLILTQELCHVCAPDFTQVQQAVGILDGDVTLLSLEPETIDEMILNIRTVGEQTGRQTKAEHAINELRKDLSNVERLTSNVHRLTICVIEWLDPLMSAGHWVPEMVERAGGEMLLGKAREKSRYVMWSQIKEADPDLLIVAPCGFNISRTRREIHLLTSLEGWSDLKAVPEDRAWLVDGDAYLTRSGPRLVEGVKILAKLCHPEIFGEPAETEAVRISRA